MYEFFTAILRHFTTLAPWRVLGIDKCGARTRAAAKHTPRKRQQEQHGKPNRKRGGAEPFPLNRFGDRLPLFPSRMAFFHWFLPFVTPLEFALSVGYGSIGLRRSQRPQNRRLKHPYKYSEPNKVFLARLFSFQENNSYSHATILALSR